MITRLMHGLFFITILSVPAFSGGLKKLFKQIEHIANQALERPECPNRAWSVELPKWYVFIRNIVYTAYDYHQGNAHHKAPQYEGEDLDGVLRRTDNLSWTHNTFKEILAANGVHIDTAQSPRGQLEDFCAIVALRNAVYSEDRAVAKLDIPGEKKRRIAQDFLRREYGNYLANVHYHDAQAIQEVIYGDLIGKKPTREIPVEIVDLAVEKLGHNEPQDLQPENNVYYVVVEDEESSGAVQESFPGGAGEGEVEKLGLPGKEVQEENPVAVQGALPGSARERPCVDASEEEVEIEKLGVPEKKVKKISDPERKAIVSEMKAARQQFNKAKQKLVEWKKHKKEKKEEIPFQAYSKPKPVDEHYKQ